MVKIASNTETANVAVAGVAAVTIQKGEQISLNDCSIMSMKTGMQLNNQLLSDLSQLINCVQKQSEKFPEIAKVMAIEDSQIKF